MIRAKLNLLGMVERKVLYIKKEKSWCKKLLEVAFTNLFAIIKLIEIQIIKLPHNFQYFQVYAKLLKSNNSFLLIRLATKIHKKLESFSVFVHILKIEDIYGWIFNRASKQYQISLDIFAISILKQKYEGNLIALDQALSNIKLINTKTVLKIQDILKTVTDNSRFKVIDLMDACLLGDTKRCVLIIQVFQILDYDVSIILWNFISELRIILWGIGSTKHKLALQRLSIYSIHTMLLFAQKIDNAIKHKKDEPIWVSLTNLALMLSGAKPYES